jgi:hypothetical protein
MKVPAFKRREKPRETRLAVGSGQASEEASPQKLRHASHARGVVANLHGACEVDAWIAVVVSISLCRECRRRPQALPAMDRDAVAMSHARQVDHSARG